MIPLFKSHFSIGRSMLTLDRSSSDGPDSIFQIIQDNKMNKLVLVEDSLMGFLHAQKVSKELGIELIFGLRLDCIGASGDKTSKNKIIVFAKNGAGCRLLNKIFTNAHTSDENAISNKDLKSLWSEKDLKLAIPFYDSFLFNNAMYFSNCIVNFSFTSPTFFIESNGLPFDSIIKDKILSYCKGTDYKTQDVKSIFYKNRQDIEAFQTYKCICSRKFGKRSLSKPNLDHFGSDEFCFESWKEQV